MWSEPEPFSIRFSKLRDSVSSIYLTKKLPQTETWPLTEIQNKITAESENKRPDMVLMTGTA